MVGSIAIAAFIAHAAFWTLLFWGWFAAEMRLRGVVIVVLFWIAGYFFLPALPYGAAMFSSFVALLDIVLVLVIFKGDVLIT